MDKDGPAAHDRLERRRGRMAGDHDVNAYDYGGNVTSDAIAGHTVATDTIRYQAACFRQ